MDSGGHYRKTPRTSLRTSTVLSFEGWSSRREPGFDQHDAALSWAPGGGIHANLQQERLGTLGREMNALGQEHPAPREEARMEQERMTQNLWERNRLQQERQASVEDRNNVREGDDVSQPTQNFLYINISKCFISKYFFLGSFAWKRGALTDTWFGHYKKNGRKFREQKT